MCNAAAGEIQSNHAKSETTHTTWTYTHRDYTAVLQNRRHVLLRNNTGMFMVGGFPSGCQSKQADVVFVA